MSGRPALAVESSLGRTGPDFLRAVEQQTFLLINQERKGSDLPALKWNDGIAKLAQAHSKDMATGAVEFGHTGFGGRVEKMKALMEGFRGAGENVLMTDNADEAPKRAVELWLKSPHHLKNIKGDYNYSGMGVWQDKDGALYFTQIFLKIEAPTAEAEAKPVPSAASTILL